ncbi:hypothetical protein DFH08DRAFT_798314 [Mycena albidolilacea]|uniref:Uncharacterized protein n=1 Tax=Mycena albidolilacea TaxID=1033008 RepID=A0AAD7AMY4_9AGAR|nr:hypothetical protein DFH08DRAFT_798314 [Mycena albidolilacea]
MPNQTTTTPPTKLRLAIAKSEHEKLIHSRRSLWSIRNLEEEWEKARERMARSRERISQQEDSRAAFLKRARQASRKHRAKCASRIAHSALMPIQAYHRNSEALAHRQRIIRLDPQSRLARAFDKHRGPHAWLKRQNSLQEQCSEAQAECRVDEPQVPQEELTG